MYNVMLISAIALAVVTEALKAVIIIKDRNNNK